VTCKKTTIRTFEKGSIVCNKIIIQNHANEALGHKKSRIN